VIAPTSLVRLALAAIAGAAALGPRLHAQRAIGPWEDAWHIPGGIFRYGVAPRFFGASDRFGLAGTRQGLGADFGGLISSDRLTTLSTLETNLSSLGSDASFRATIGTARNTTRNTSAVIPLQADIGITRWLSAHVMAPFVTGKQETQLYLDPAGATVGANPQLLAGVVTQNAAVVNGLGDAATQLEQLADQCAIDPTANTRCVDIVADISAVRSLIDDARTTGDLIAQIYGGRAGTEPSLFVPLAGSATQTAVAARIEAMRLAFERYGSSPFAQGTAPSGAGSPATITQLTDFLSDTAFGFALGPLRRRYSQGIGDIEGTLSLLVFDGVPRGPSSLERARTSFAIRQTVMATYRLGTGTPVNADDPFKLGTGDGQDDIEIASATDLVMGTHAWASVFVRWTKQMAYDGVTRIPDASGSPLIPLDRRRNAETQLGDRIMVSAAPRWAFNDRLAVGMRYVFTRQDGTQITELAPASGPALRYTGPVANAHEIGIGFAWSNIVAWSRGRAHLPIELQYDHSLVVAGSGNVARFSADRVSLRAYARLWGR
jgi:hypothetical protein